MSLQCFKYNSRVFKINNCEQNLEKILGLVMTCCWLNVLTFPMQVMAESLKAYTCIACAISVFSKQQCYLNLSFLQEHLQKKKKRKKSIYKKE